MMKRWLVPFAVCLMLGFPHDGAGLRYAIVAPRIVRPHSTYEVMVTNVAEQVQQFRCEIVNSKNNVLYSQSVRVNPNQIEQANIGIGPLTEQNYQLRVWDQHRNQLLNSTSLQASSKSYTVLFQTDKPLYNPGDKVQFRVLFLLPNGKPVTKDVTATIFITDANRFRMQQWTNATLQHGVFEGSFQLAQHTTLGSWSISALISEQDYTDSFSVNEHVLPMFKIEVESLSKPFHCAAPQMELGISAMYMGGGMVHGNATVVVRANYNTYPSQTKEIARQELQLDGSSKVQFPTSIVTENCDEERRVWFDVSVADRVTGLSYNVTKMFTVQRMLYNMEPVGTYEAFHPGIPLSMKIQLSSVDGLPEKNKTVYITYRVVGQDQELDDTIREHASLQTDSMGIVKVKINTTEDTIAVVVEGQYKNITFQLAHLDPFYEDRDVEFLAAFTGSVYHTVSGKFRLYLRSNVLFKRIFYIGYCRQTVCASGSHEWHKNKKRGFLEIAANPTMAPQMKLLVFTVKDGLILSSPVVVRFTTSGEDRFQLAWTKIPRSKEQLEQVNFSITGESGAFIGLLGVDQRITLRPSSKNDITLEKMENAMQSTEDSMDLWSVYDSFGSVGMALLTDGYLPDVGFVPHSAPFVESRSLEDDDPSVRQDFPDTWIWESLTVTDGKGTLKKRMPDTVTTWLVTGFSLSEEHGLVILKEPLRIPKIKKVYAQLHVPAAVKRREEVAAYCLIHNNDKEITVNVEGLPNLRPSSRVQLAKGETRKIPFTFVADKIGVLMMNVVLKATNGDIIDAMKQPITVHPDGVVNVVEDVRLVNQRMNRTTNLNFALRTLVAERNCSAAEVKFSVIGTLVNLNQFDLGRMVAASYGNGETNLLVLQTAIAVYEYLATTGQLSESARNKLVGHMEAAYQQHLRFRLDNGSFSMFGSVRKCGGIWFTAATVETLVKAIAYVSVDSVLITGGLNWLAAQSRDDGSFNESCSVAHPHIQSTGGKELSLASSVMFAFVGHPFSHHFTPVINKTVSLLTSENIEDVYVLAKTTYLLSLIRHPKLKSMRETLNELAKKKGLYYYWSVGEQVGSLSRKTRNQGATAYALLVNLNDTVNTETQQKLDDFLRTVQWIQQNSFTNDLWTPSFEKVVALRALKALHDVLPSVEPSMIVSVGQRRLYIKASNRTLLQTVALQSDVRDVNVSLEGKGLLMIKLSYRCTMPTVSAKNPISTPSINGLSSVKIKEEKRQQVLTWSICVVHMPRLIRCPLEKINIYLPTGFQMVEQPRIHYNQTASAVSLDHDTQQELIFNAAETPDNCFLVKAHNYFALQRVARGSLKICPMDTKDECVFFQLY